MMELSAVRVIHNPLPVHTRSQPVLPCTRTRSPFILKHTRFSSGLRYCVNSPLSSTTSGETSIKTADKPDPVDEKKECSDPQLNEADKVERDYGAVKPFFSTTEEKEEEESGAKLYAADKVERDYGAVKPFFSTTEEKKEEESGAKLYGADKVERDYGAVKPFFSATEEKKEEESGAKLYGADKVEDDGGAVKSFFSSTEEKKEDDSGAKLYGTDKVEGDGGVVTYTPPEEKKEDLGAMPCEADEPKTESVVIVENASLDEKKEDSNTLPDLQKIFDDLGIKIDVEENKYSILTIGGGSIIALWLASAVVGAIDHIPLLPKLLELVGLGYSVWFAIRYVIFEENRRGLLAKVEQVKQDIFGSDA